jgi:hypothetical protein
VIPAWGDTATVNVVYQRSPPPQDASMLELTERPTLHITFISGLFVDKACRDQFPPPTICAE